MHTPLASLAQPQTGSAVCKRLFDVVTGAVALIILSPFLVAVALIIRLDSSGPIFFRQTRIGRFGKPFTLLKFRTMTNWSDDAIHRQAIEKVWAGEPLSDDPDAPFKLVADPRITRAGSWLRRTSIDEAPQLLNVLRGDMSLVGPRPMIEYELDHFQPRHHERHEVLPGITGLAQVTGRGRAGMEDMLELDVEYVRTQSFYSDLKLVLMTIPVVLKGIGAR